MPDKPNIWRRRLLWGGGATILLAGGGVVWRGVERGAFTAAEGPAYEAWDLWGDPDLQGTPVALVAAGALAANAHNTQPWLFEISETEIKLYADLSRHLGSFDPYLREMHLSLGCALENIRVAAPAHGFKANIVAEEGSLEDPAPRTGRRLTARVRLERMENDEQAPLVDVLARRHTDRGPYDRARAVPDPMLTDLSRIAEDFPDTRFYWFREGPERDQFDQTTVAATERIITDAPMSADSDKWFRMTKKEVETHRDGITLDAAGLPPAILTIAKLLPRVSPEEAHQSWLASTRDVHLPSAAVTGFIAVRDLYDIPQTLDAGMAWQRLHLTAVDRGLAMHPINQCVEIVDREKELAFPPRMAQTLAELIGTEDWHPTFAFRAGYPKTDALPSPRRVFDDIIV